MQAALQAKSLYTLPSFGIGLRRPNFPDKEQMNMATKKKAGKKKAGKKKAGKTASAGKKKTGKKKPGKKRMKRPMKAGIGPPVPGDGG
jgi:hypothetical protein